MGFFLLMYLWERTYTTEVGSDEAFKSTVRNKERWIFVNGMCVDNNLGYGNALQLSKLFNRQVQFFHNPTQGLLFDFFECMVGRTFNFQTPVSRSLAKCLTTAINGPHDKVVLVAHSQGGIISSNAVELLIKRGVPVDRLEVYTFGSAADEFMQVHDKETQKSYPYYEHYAHEEDFVAQIGILHWDIPGNVYTAKKIGHFMGDHYLPSFKNKEFSLYCGTKREPKLYKYMDNAKKELQKENPVSTTKSVKPAQHTTTNRKIIHNNDNNDKNELSPHSPSPAKARLSSSPPSDTTKQRALSAQE